MVAVEFEKRVRGATGARGAGAGPRSQPEGMVGGRRAGRSLRAGSTAELKAPL